MTPADWAFIVTLIGTTGIAALAARLVWSIWVGRPLRPIPIAVPLGVALLSTTILTAGSPAPETLLVAGAVYQMTPVTIPHFQIEERGAHVTVHGSQTAAAGRTLWAVLEDLRTGTYWLQGPAQEDGAQVWRLDLVVGPDERGTTLPYRATVFAASPEIGAEWRRDAAERAQLTLGSMPPESAWLAPSFLVGAGRSGAAMSTHDAD